jgi:GNAT superfamily N-acetyltransferase
MNSRGRRHCIRPLQETDRQAVLEMCRQMLRDSPYSFLPCDDGKLNHCFDGYLADRENRCGLAAVENNLIIGVLAGYVSEYLFCHERIACDQIVYVVPGRRGAGAALGLLRAFRQWARERGARELALGVSASLEPQRVGRFYERLGLRFAGGLYKQRLY